MKKDAKNGFWIFESNFISSLLILSHLANYEADNNDFDAIKFGLVGTSADKRIWYDYQLIGSTIIDIQVAYDENDSSIIFFSLSFDQNLAEKIEFMIYIVQEFNVNHRNYINL